MAAAILQGVGGAENLLSVDHCITRLRLEVKDMSRVDDAAIRAAGAPGVIRPGKNALQIVIGTSVQFVAEDLELLRRGGTVAAQPAPAPAPRRTVTHHDLIFAPAPSLIDGDTFSFTVTDRTGIHARPAGMIADIVKRYDCEVTVSAGDKSASAASVIGLMSLGAPDQAQALSALYAYMKENL